MRNTYPFEDTLLIYLMILIIFLYQSQVSKKSRLFGRNQIYVCPMWYKIHVYKKIPYSYQIICRKEIFQMCLTAYKPFEFCVHDEYCNINPLDLVIYAEY